MVDIKEINTSLPPPDHFLGFYQIIFCLVWQWWALVDQIVLAIE